MTRSSPQALVEVFAIAAFVTPNPLAVGMPAPILINESPSLPKGLYLRLPDAAPTRGAIVAFPQPMAARPYLASLGMPAEVRLLKRVAARGGDRVCAGDGRISTPARSAPILTLDRRGAPLTAWTSCRALAADEIFVLGDTPNSFDSRYFGPVRRADVEGIYREVITW
jgi:conjugative transfer signal peptidase TraF